MRGQDYTFNTLVLLHWDTRPSCFYPNDRINALGWGCLWCLETHTMCLLLALTTHGSQMSMLLAMPPTAEGRVQGVLADAWFFLFFSSPQIFQCLLCARCSWGYLEMKETGTKNLKELTILVDQTTSNGTLSWRNQNSRVKFLKQEVIFSRGT